MRGLAASPGIAIGRVLRLDEHGRHQFYYVQIPGSRVRGEVKRLRKAVDEARAQIEEIKARLARELGYRHAFILDAHELMLEDKNFIGEMEEAIRARRINSEWAVRDVTGKIAAAYKQVSDTYLRERVSDIEDIATRLLTVLSGHKKFDLSTLDQSVVVVAESIWPSTIAELDFTHVLGFATDAGGLTSHSAIIARALALPATVGLHNITHQVRTRDAVILDGSAGEVVLNPTRAAIRRYVRKRDTARRGRSIPAPFQPAETLDGIRIPLRANVELPTEIDSLRLFGAEGIGLYRSEFLFLNRLPELPSEDEQYEVYRVLAEAAGEAGANIRVFDLGGDKLALDGFKEEQNPALGLRAIRLSLRAEYIFRAQIRAILRANLHGRLRIVLPLITTISELREARRVIGEVKHEMMGARVEHKAELPIGIMIEVPAAAMMADALGREADFLSVGTNDLIQYMLAVDRANENVAHLYQPLHPAVLRTIAHVARCADAARIPLELCGEMAADPVQAVAVAGLGVRALSLVPASIPLIKSAIRSVELNRVRTLLGEAMKLASSEDVEQLLSGELARQAPEFFEAASAPGEFAFGS
jgi:phosphotransferase system enzyme I (PtsI)